MIFPILMPCMSSCPAAAAGADPPRPSESNHPSALRWHVWHRVPSTLEGSLAPLPAFANRPSGREWQHRPVLAAGRPAVPMTAVPSVAAAVGSALLAPSSCQLAVPTAPGAAGSAPAAPGTLCTASPQSRTGLSHARPSLGR